MVANLGRGWRRIGIVLSVIWFIGFGGYLLADSWRTVKRAYSSEFQKCSSPNAVEPWRKCWDEVADRHWRAQEENFRNVPLLLAIDLGTILFGWLVIWGIVGVARRINRGSASA
jgi:TRAP-type C4-dicarboxylate transport system permease small subunit